MRQHFKYEPGDQVIDTAFDPPIPGIVTAKHKEADTYYVRLTERADDVMIHARNLKRN